MLPPPPRAPRPLQVPELNVQNGVLKALSFLFEYIGEMGKDYIYAGEGGGVASDAREVKLVLAGCLHTRAQAREGLHVSACHTPQRMLCAVAAGTQVAFLGALREPAPACFLLL